MSTGNFPTQLLSKLEKISLQSVNVGDLVGKGRFKRVHKGRWRGRDVVLLRYSKDTQRGFSPPKQRGVGFGNNQPEAIEEELDKNLNELKILSSIAKKENSQYVPEIYGVCHEPKSTIIVQEFAPWGMLKNNLKDPAFTSIVTNLHKIHCAKQIGQSMAFLESEHIVHADLSARNVLIFRCEEAPHSIVAKVSDFGLSAVLKEGSDCEYRKQPMPTRWCSPETVFKNKLSHKADCWSYGVTCWEIYASGQDPWPLRSKRGDVAARLRDLAENGSAAEGGADVSADFPKSDDCPDVVHKAYLSCFKADEDERPRFKQLAQTFQRIIDAGGDKDSNGNDSVFPPEAQTSCREPLKVCRRQSIEPDSAQWNWWREKAEEDAEIAARLKVLKKFSESERELLLEAESRLLKQRQLIDEMKKEVEKRGSSVSAAGASANVVPEIAGVSRAMDMMYTKYGEMGVDCPVTPPMHSYRPSAAEPFSHTPPCTPPPRWGSVPPQSARRSPCFTLWSVTGGMLYQQDFPAEMDAKAAFFSKRQAGHPCSLRNLDGQEIASSSWQALDSYWKEAWKHSFGANFFQGVRIPPELLSMAMGPPTNQSPPRCAPGSSRERHTIGGGNWNGNNSTPMPGSSVNVNISPPVRVVTF